MFVGFSFYLLAKTIIIESFPFILLIKKQSILYKLFFIVLINLFTNPLAQFAFYGFEINFWIVEAIVIMIEAILIYYFFKIKLYIAFIVSILINALSSLFYLLS